MNYVSPRIFWQRGGIENASSLPGNITCVGVYIRDCFCEVPMSGNGFDESELKHRTGWFIFLVLSGVGAYIAGTAWLFSNATCPRLQHAVLLLVAAVLVVAGLLFALKASNAPVVQLGSVIGLFLLILLVATVVGAVASASPQVRGVFCPGSACRQLEEVKELRRERKIRGAEDIARECLKKRIADQHLIRVKSQKLQKWADTSLEQESNCQKQCAKELALVLYERSDPASNSESCQEKIAHLQEAAALGKEWELDQEVTLLINERLQRVANACGTPLPTSTPTPSPTPTATPTPPSNVTIEVLRHNVRDSSAIIDVRVYREGQMVRGLTPKDFEVMVNRKKVPFTLSERKADDPVCLIAVVDNSGSILPGLAQIKSALEKLNEARKPMDELGLIVFGAHDNIHVYQTPSRIPLDVSVVDGSGKQTALWDALLKGIEESRHCTAANRYIVVLTDGRDNDSRRMKGDSLMNARALAELAARRHVNVCTVGVKSKQLDPEPLKLAAYGCGYYTAQNFDELGSLFTSLFGYVRDFYRISLKDMHLSSSQYITVQVLKSAEVNVNVVSNKAP